MRTAWLTQSKNTSQEDNQRLWQEHLAYLNKTYPTTSAVTFITPEELERRTRPVGIVKQWVFLGDAGW